MQPPEDNGSDDYQVEDESRSIMGLPGILFRLYLTCWGLGKTREPKSAPSSLSRSPSIDGSQNGPPLYAIWGSLLLRLALVDPTGRHLRAYSAMPAV